MCGIYGWIKNNVEDNERLRLMGGYLKHRGPDDEGIFEDETVILGHKRLSIIDLSPSGKQPMSNEDNSVQIVFNGEIYNFMSIREQIEDRHRFRSKTDTEVLLHLYEERGRDVLHEINGMFAFAIWDKRKKELFLARDRFGKKPLYYYWDGKKFVFSSEMRAILETGIVPREFSPHSIHDYLSYQYIPAPKTSVKNIRKVEPGSYLLWKNGQIQAKRYWTLRFDRKKPVCEKNLEEELFEKFKEAVRKRLIADVPLGAFLSGGVDSSAVVAAMAMSENNEAPKTFTIGFDYETYDETPYARKVSETFTTDHTEFTVKADAISLLPKLVEFYGEPFADSSAIPTYYVSEICREKVKVVLSGDGGDELFCGYPRYSLINSDPKTERFPISVRHLIDRVALKIPRNRRGFCRIRRKLDELGLVPEISYFDNICYFLNSDKDDLYTGDFKDTVGKIESFDILYDLFSSATAKNFTEKLMEVDINSYLPNDLLVKVDIASMAHGLEVRAPFLDYEFAEYVCSLPLSFKFRDGESKWILKRILSQYLPREVIYRKKMGFGVPLREWFRSELKEFAADILLSERCLKRGLFQRNGLEKLLLDHFHSRKDNAYKIYALLFLELWMVRFIDGKPF